MDDRLIKVRDTGRRVSHPDSCGGCHGQGCPIVELVWPTWRDWINSSARLPDAQN